MSWFSVEFNVLQNPCHTDLRIDKWEVPHPTIVGFQRSTGEFQGQIADYRKSVSNGRSLHAREFHDHYLVHWDIVDPLKNPILHLLVDAPHLAVIIGAIGLGIFSIGLSSIFSGE